MALSEDLHTIPHLFGNAVEQLGKLVQTEAELAKAELSQKITQVGIGAAYVGGAAILFIPVLVVFLIALALWLVQLGLSPIEAHFAAAGIGVVVCGILAAMGLSYLKPENLAPEATVNSINRDIATAKGLAR